MQHNRLFEAIRYQRYFELIGEGRECKLLLDQRDGYLYCPYWFNLVNSNSFKFLSDIENFLATEVIEELEGWQIVTEKMFYDFPVNFRVEFFNTEFEVKINRENGDTWPQKASISSNNALNSEDGRPFIYHKKYINSDFIGVGNEDKFLQFLQNSPYEIKFRDIVVFKDLKVNYLKNVDIKQEKESIKDIFEIKDINSRIDIIDFKTEIEKYNLSELKKSLPSTYKAIVKHSDYMMSMIEQFISKNRETLKLSHNIFSTILSLRDDITILSLKKSIFLRELTFSLNSLESRLNYYKSEAISGLSELKKLNSIYGFREQSDKKIDFYLFVEITILLFNEEVQRLKEFKSLSETLLELSKFLRYSQNDYERFLSKDRESFRAFCEKEFIDELRVKEYINNWNIKIDFIELQLLSLMRAFFRETVDRETIVKLYNMLFEFRKAVDEFYLHRRVSLYQKLAFEPNSDIQDRFETELQILELIEKVDTAVDEIISKSKNRDTKQFLSIWSKEFFNSSINSILSFIQQNRLEALKTLRDRDLNGSYESYSEDKQMLKREFDSLVFKIRQELKSSTIV
jgi:hypothetical protein